MFNRILVVCVGNICRSPMAEALLRSVLPPDCEIASAGIGAMAGNPADSMATDLMHERGLDIEKHVARQLDLDLLRNSDLVLVMERAHQDWIESRWPQARGRVYRWGHWSDFDVPDPHCQDAAAFRQSLALIEQGLANWKERL